MEGGGDVAADTVRLYLREIGGTALLKAYDETELAMRMERGREAEAKLAVLGIPSSVPNWAASASDRPQLAANQRNGAAKAGTGHRRPDHLPDDPAALAEIDRLIVERDSG